MSGQHTPLAQSGSRRGSVWLAEAVLTLVSVAIVATAVIVMRPDWGHLIFGQLQHIRFEGAYKHLDRLELESVTAPHLGKNLFDIDLARLEARFAKLPWVQGVVMRRIWPDTLVVEIKERQAVARWGKQGLIDDTGAVFFPDHVDYPELSVFLTAADRNRIALDFYHRLVDWLQMPASEIGYLIEDANRSRTAVLKRGMTLVIGRRDTEARVKRFARAYANGLGDIATHIACVDLRYADGFAVRWKEKERVSC